MTKVRGICAMILMTDLDFLENGFHKFQPTQFDSDGVEACFQKRYDDEVGKKYFITVKKWRPMTHPHTKETFGPGYEYNVQMYKKGSHDAVDILFHSSWTLKDVESYMEQIWNTGLFDYYEEFAE